MGQQLKIPFVDGMKVGLGFDLLTGKPTSSAAVTGSSITPPQQGGGQTVTTTFRLVQEVDALEEALGLSASVAGGYAGFQGTAKLNFSKQCSVTQYCLYVVLSVEVINSCVSMDSPALVPDAVELLRAGNTTRFRERFGNRYISGLKTGGEYYAVYRVQSFDQEERGSISAKIAASFHNPLLSASLNTEIESSKSASLNSLDVSVFVFSAGGVSTTETALGEMIEKAHRFPSLVAGPNAIPYQVILDEYSGLDLPGDDLNFFDVEHQTETLLFNSRLLNGFETLVNDVDFIRQHSDRFHNPDGSSPNDNALQTVRRSCLEAVDALQKSISACRKNANACSHFLQSPQDFINQLPILRFPRPGQLKVPRLIGLKAVDIDDRFSFTKSKRLVDLMLEQGFYFVIDNAEVLHFGIFGSPTISPTAGNIVTQTPAEDTLVTKGAIIHVTVSPIQENLGPGFMPFPEVL